MNALLKAVHFAFFAAHGFVVEACAAVFFLIACENFFIRACCGHAQRIVYTLDRVEIAHHQHRFALFVLSQESHHALGTVIRNDPLEALPGEVFFPELRMLQIEVVEIAHISLRLLVGIIVQQQPIQLLFFVPLDKLCKLTAHKQQLFAGMCHHIAKKGAQVCKLIGILAGHFVYKASLAMHYFIVADGQHKVFAEGVEEAECHLVVVAYAEQRVGLHIAEHIVHPAHVPFKVKAKAAVSRRLAYQRECCGFLGDHHFVGMTAQNGSVQLAQKVNGFQIFISAVDVLLPLAVLAVIVQIQHTGHCIHAQAVDMVLLQPEQGAGDQEGLHFGHAEVEHHGAPFLMLAAPGVGVFIAGQAVKIIQAVAVLGEVCRHPVHDHADACLMQLVYKGHEILGCAVAAGGGEIARYLIAPAAVKRILGDGQKLHMGVAHILYVGDQLIGQLGIIVGHAALFGAPAACVHFVDIQRRVDHIGLFLCLFPLGIAPLIALNVIHLTGVGGACFGMECIGIGLELQIIRRGGNTVFIHIILLNALDKGFPNAIAHGIHRVAAGDPTVKVAHYAYRLGVGRPHAEHHALLCAAGFRMCAKIAVCFKIIPFMEKIYRELCVFI